MEHETPTVELLLGRLVEDRRIDTATVESTRTWTRERLKGTTQTAEAQLVVAINTTSHGTNAGIAGGKVHVADLILDGNRIERCVLRESAPWGVVDIVAKFMER